MKIFGIGLSKTGTTSLASALEILGYRTRDYPGLTSYSPGNLSSIDARLLDDHDALTDTPIPSFFRELDARYPGSKFILTVRDMDGWLLSCKKQFTPKLAEKQNEAHNRLFMDLYGTTVFDEPMFRSGYERFVDGVRQHFRGRPQDLLELDVAGGAGWEALCAFLDKPVPAVPFPKANVTRIRWMDLQELVSIAKEAGQELLRAHSSIVPIAAGAAAPKLISTLVRRTAYSLRGGRSGALENATVSAQKVLLRRLEKLNAEIPMISRQEHVVPHPERARWNHFWMIDSLDGEKGFGAADGEFTVNIALIEDQKPIAGVVHAPLSGTTYFAMVGKGAFKTTGEGPASRLSVAAEAAAGPAAVVDQGSPSKALSLCRLVEVGATAGEIAESMEWHSAAPHALARLIGRRLVAAGSAKEITYNKAGWSNPVIKVT